MQNRCQRAVSSTLMLLMSCFALVANAQTVNLSAFLDTDQEESVASETPVSAGGMSSLSYDTDTNTLTWEITFAALSAPATMAHFHGAAAPGSNAGVKLDIGAVSGLVSPLTGSAQVDQADEADLLAGLWYINIHTALNGGGEIRGQVFDASGIETLISRLDRTQESEFESATPTQASGQATVYYDPASNLMGWSIDFAGLSDAITAAHFHGPAAAGANAGVKQAIGFADGLTSPLVGSAVLAESDEADLLGGLWYINLHTALNAGGEVRGQVLDREPLIFLTSSLDRGQETTPVDPATPEGAGGQAELVFDPRSNLLTWNIAFGNLSGMATAAHFHGPAGDGFPAGVRLSISDVSGLDTGMYGAAVLDAAPAAELLAGLWYINIHTALNSDGEIRGQLAAAAGVGAIYLDGFEQR